MNPLIVRRPLFWFSLVFFSATALTVYIGEQNGLPLAAVSITALAFILTVPILRRQVVLCLVPLAVALAAILTCARYYITVSPVVAVAEQTAEISAVVTALPSQDAKLYRATVLQSDTLPKNTKICLSFADKENAPDIHSTVQGTVRLYAPADNRYRSEDIFICAYAEQSMTVTEHTLPWYIRLRRTACTQVRQLLTGDEGALLNSITLGDMSDLSASIQKDFRTAGLTHVLVVSGLHMTILAGAVMALAKQISLPRVIAVALTLAILWAFMLLVGFSSSVIRAGVMLHFVLLSQVLRARADTLTSLGAALLCILLLSPYAATDVGFLLSFAATLGLVILTPLMHEMVTAIPFFHAHTRLENMLSVLYTPTAALIATAPIMAVYFHTFSLYSLPANLLTVWAVTLLLPPAAIGMLLLGVPLIGGIGKGLLFVCGLLCKWVLLVARVIDELPFANLQVRHTPIFLLLLCVPVALYVAWRLRRGRGMLRVTVCALVLLLVCNGVLQTVSRRTFSLRMANAEDTLVAVTEFAGHSGAVISGEDAYAYRTALFTFADYGVSNLDFLVVTDGDYSTTASLASLLEEISVNTVIIYDTHGDWTQGISGIHVKMLSEDGGFQYGNSITVERYDRTLRLSLGETRVLFTDPHADIRTLPVPWRRTHLLVMRQSVPTAVDTVTATQAVMLCEQQDVAAQTAALPWGKYPITLAAQSGESAFLTAGRGDITLANQYWL